MRDRLVLLKPVFSDPKYPGEDFYCRDCGLLEGVLALFPELSGKLEIERIDWPRPRRRLVELAGDGNLSLPMLLMAESTVPVTDVDVILEKLSERFGIPKPHP